MGATIAHTKPADPKNTIRIRRQKHTHKEKLIGALF
jgi:hypothetical protein